MAACRHLASLESFLRSQGVAVEAEGASWWSRCSGGWVYFACSLAPSLHARFHLPDFVRYSEYDGRTAGQEAGFACSRCESGVVGVHPSYAAGLPRFS